MDTNESFDLRLPGSEQIIRVYITRSARAGRMTLRVKPDASVSVVVPARARGNISESARLFALTHLDWLDRQIEKFARKANAVPEKTLTEYLSEHPQIFIDEHPLTIELNSTWAKPFFVLRPNESVLPIYLGDRDPEADLRACLAAIAKEVLPPRVRMLAERCGVSVSKISIRNQQSRWGSCTTQGALSLNWRILLLPPEIRDHVLLHELAHRRYMNHSDDFWDLLYTWDPEADAHNKALQNVWASLFRFRASS